MFGFKLEKAENNQRAFNGDSCKSDKVIIPQGRNLNLQPGQVQYFDQAKITGNLHGIGVEINFVQHTLII